MVDILHRIGIKAPIAQVYQSIATRDGLANWWTVDTRGESRVGGQLEFVFIAPTGEQMGAMVMDVQVLNAPSEVRWRCTGGPPEWIGTDITFELSQQDDKTIILFGHRSWREAIEATYHCSTKWAVFMLSLREYVGTGKGKPSPHDVKIDNWT